MAARSPLRSVALYAPLLVRTVAFGLALLLPACLTNSDVVRVFDGEPAAGRFIRSDAYALFMQGVIEERSGHLAAAERLYIEASRRDRQGAAILVRLAAVRCAWGPKGYEPAERTFEQAEEIERAYAPIYVERARCALRRKRLDDAERLAREGMARAPEDIGASLLLAKVLERRGKIEQAARVLDAFAYAFPSKRVWHSVEGLARRRGDAARARLAAQHLGRKQPAGAMDRVDAAIVDGDLDEARALATETGMDQGHLAVRAAALGMWEVARKLARVVLAAEPGHPDATVAWLASPQPQAALQSVEPAMWHRLLRAGRTRRGLSDLGRLVFADTLRRRFRTTTARVWLRSWGGLAPVGEDSLSATIRKRLDSPAPRPMTEK